MRRRTDEARVRLPLRILARCGYGRSRHRRWWKRHTAKYWRRRGGRELDEAPRRQVQRWWP